MSEMVQRVACAIGSALSHHPMTPETKWGAGPTRLSGEPVWKTYEAAARAAIEALGVPTEAMLDAGGSVEFSEGNVSQGLAGKVFTAMIDAALAD